MDKGGNDPPGSVEEGEEVMDDDSDEEDRCNDDENTIQTPLSKKARKSHCKMNKVTCGEEGCIIKPRLLQNLKDHAKTKHGSSHPKINGQPTISSMFLGGKESRKRRGPDSGVIV